VVVLLSVKERGLLIQKRGIEPQKGGWALTGGYIDDRETWQHAAVREVREELGLETKEKDYKLWDVTSSTNKENILIFCTYEHTLNSIEGLNFKTNNEVEAVDVMWEPMTLAFPAHTEHANKYLAKLNEE
jgi:ADP-ribose pyrophosphatase YjhB (NUDIX family)